MPPRPGGIAGQAEADVVERRAVRVPGVLQRAVLEQQAGADGTDAGRRGGVEQLGEPVRR